VSQLVNVKYILDTTPATVYTVPSSKTAIVIGAQIANVDESVAVATVSWTDSSDSDTETVLVDSVPVPVASAFEPFGGKFVLEDGDTIKVVSDEDDFLHMTISVLEI
jgi:hypothetical protein